MMNGAGNFNSSNWQSFSGPPAGPPPSKFHPMMSMGMGGMNNGMGGMGMGGMGMGGMGMGGMGGPNSNVPQCSPAFHNSTNSNFNSDRDMDRYSPSSGNMRPPSDRPSSGSFQSYDSHYGMNGPMGPGMMNGPSQYGPQGMYGQQQQFSDDRENVNGGGNFPSQSHRQYYDGCGPTGMPGGMGGNMMGMSRNYNEHSSRNSHGGGSYPPMHMQNGYPGGGGGFCWII